MAQVTVTANNIRVNDAQSNAGWSNEGGGGPSPNAEPQLKYTGSNAVNRKVTATTARQGVQYNAGASYDMTLAANRLWLAKVYVADFGDLNSAYGVEIGIGSAAGARYEFNVAGSGANRAIYDSYPAAGGYLIAAIDPQIAAWREAVVGSPALGAVDHFEVACQFVSGGAKSENVAMSAIDIGTGLTLTGGDGTDPDGAFADFVAADQGTVANRWGYASEKDGALTFRGMMTIGGAQATAFKDDSAKVSFPDGYHSAGAFGITLDLQNAASQIQIGASLTGLGNSAVEDTRPDYIVTGTAGTHALTGVLDNFRQITLSSAVTVSGAALRFSQLSPNGAVISGARLRVNTTSGAAAITDPDFAKLTECQFIQTGAGHAIEISSPGSFSLSGLSYSGFGAEGANDAVFFNNSGGAVTLNIVGGNGPSVRNGTGATTLVQNSVPVTLSGLVAGSRIYIRNVTDGVTLFNLVEAGTEFSNSLNYTADKALLIRVRHASGATKYKPFQTTGTLGSAGFSLTVNQELDE